MLLREIIQYGDALGLTILMIAFVIARVLGLFGHWQISIKVRVGAQQLMRDEGLFSPMVSCCVYENTK